MLNAMDPLTQLPVVGMIGGGQLARMTHQSVISLGQSLHVLAASATDAAATIAAKVEIGMHDDLDALRHFAINCDVVTFDHEHVPGAHIRALVADGTVVRPGPEALRYAQDKLQMRQRLAQLDMPMPRWAPISSIADLAEFTTPCVVKTPTGGYDGKGVFVIDEPSQAAELLAVEQPLLAEELVGLDRELAVVVARSASGDLSCYPVVETVQQDGVCTEVIAPASGLAPQQALLAQQIASQIAEALGVVGVMAVELFETNGRLVVNELAMRPHNSGHWTIEGAQVSQFEQHIRAICDYRLGETTPTAPVTVMANVLGGQLTETNNDRRLRKLLAADPGVHVHLYGKQVRPGRKIGHVTVQGDNVDVARRRAVRAAAYLRDGG